MMGLDGDITNENVRNISLTDYCYFRRFWSSYCSCCCFKCVVIVVAVVVNFSFDICVFPIVSIFSLCQASVHSYILIHNDTYLSSISSFFIIL